MIAITNAHVVQDTGIVVVVVPTGAQSVDVVGVMLVAERAG